MIYEVCIYEGENKRGDAVEQQNPSTSPIHTNNVLVIKPLARLVLKRIKHLAEPLNALLDAFYMLKTIRHTVTK